MKILLYNGNVRASAAASHPAQAILIDGGKIAAVGDDAEILALADVHTHRENLQGKTVWPGLCDAHLHLQQYAQSLAKIDCETETKAETLRRVAEAARTQPPGTWILGHGWNQNRWDGYGTAAELDDIAPHHPVYLTAKSLHASWANSSALRLAGVTEQSADPEGGQFGRAEDGRLNGLLLEYACNVVEAVIPSPGGVELQEMLLRAQQNLLQMGITCVHDFDRVDCFRALQTLDSRGELILRVVKSLPLAILPHLAASGLQTGFGSNHLRIGSVKLFADGALGPRTAAMFAPYENEPENKGFLLMDAEQIFEEGREATKAGLSVAVHAIGDLANHAVLQAYAQLRDFEREQHIPPLRHRIEHVQILHPSDLQELARLNITASVQPIHATSDMRMADQAWGERTTNAYAYRTLLRSGAPLICGSDAPVESPNPFVGIHAAVTRRDSSAYTGASGWNPQQRLSLAEALGGWTSGPAWTAGWETFLGKLAPGFAADLILLDKDPFALPPQELAHLRPSAVMSGGSWAWRNG